MRSARIAKREEKYILNTKYSKVTKERELMEGGRGKRTFLFCKRWRHDAASPEVQNEVQLCSDNLG